MTKTSHTIVLTGGGSGGHITPLLSLARELKKKSPDCQLIYVGFKGDNFDSLRTGGSDFDFTVFIQAGKFRRYHGESFLSHLFDVKTLLLNVRDFFRVIRSIGTSLRILGRFQPDVIFSKGGFVAVPVGIAARLKRIPIITHDSDAVPGMANRIVGRWAKLHAVGMPDGQYPYPKDSTRFVGIPLSPLVKPVTQKTKNDFMNNIGLPLSSQMLFVGSGGNGSRTINQLVLKAARTLLASNLSLHIVHVTGKDNLEEVKTEYDAVLDKQLRARVKTFGFVEDFYKYSGAADVIVGRAGATAISEFALQGKACVIIPSPFLAGGHQLKNAQYLADHDAAVVLDNDVQADELIGVVGELLADADRRTELAQNISRLAVPDAASRLAGLVLNVTKTRGR